MRIQTVAHSPSRGELLLAAWRQIRRLKLHLQLANERRRALAAALHEAVALLGEQSVELDRLRERYHKLLDERRAARQSQRPAA